MLSLNKVTFTCAEAGYFWQMNQARSMAPVDDCLFVKIPAKPPVMQLAASCGNQPRCRGLELTRLRSLGSILPAC